MHFLTWYKGQCLHKDLINLTGLSVSTKLKTFHLPHSSLKYGQILCCLKVTVPKWYSKVEIKLILNSQNLNLKSILLTTYLYSWKRSKWLKQQVRPARCIIAVKGLLSQGKSNHWMWLGVTGINKKGRWRERSLVDMSESSL